jgi:hypothetical protein
VKSWLYRQRKKDAQSAPVAATILPAETDELIEIPSELSEKQTFYTDRMSDAACRLADYVSRLDGDGLVRNADKISKGDKTARAALKLDTTTGNPIIQLSVLCAPVSDPKPLPSMVRPQKQLPDAESD